MNAAPMPAGHGGMYQKPLAMAYVTPQPQITQIYSASDSLRIGTLFPELNMPFLGSRGGRVG